MPLLVKNGDQLDAEFFISIDNHMIDVKGNLTKGIMLLFESIFVLHLQYPSQSLDLFRLMERIFGLSTVAPAPGIERIFDKIAKTTFE